MGSNPAPVLAGFDTVEAVYTDSGLERAVVAAGLLDEAVLAGLLELRPDHFADTDAGKAWALVLEDRLDEARTLAAGWAPSPDPAADRLRVEQLAAGRLFSGVTRTLGALVARVALGEATLDEARAQFAEAALRAVEQTTPGPELAPAAHALPAVLAEIDRRAEHFTLTGDSIMGLRTELPTLDALTGGVQPGAFATLLARPNVGKTTLTNQFAYRFAAAGAVVCFVSFENPREDLVRKQLARLSGRSAGDILRGKVRSSELDEAARAFARSVGDRLYYVEGRAATTTSTIRGYVIRLRKRHPGAPIVVVVDYLQKLALRPTGQGGAGYDDLRGNVGRVSQELRDIAAQLGVSVIAISSVNRAAYASDKAKPGLASGKESGSLEFDADLVLILDEDDEGLLLAGGATPMRLRVEKNRYGPLGSVPLAFDGALARFDERETR